MSLLSLFSGGTSNWGISKNFIPMMEEDCSSSEEDDCKKKCHKKKKCKKEKCCVPDCIFASLSTKSNSQISPQSSIVFDIVGKWCNVGITSSFMQIKHTGLYEIHWEITATAGNVDSIGTFGVGNTSKNIIPESIRSANFECCNRVQVCATFITCLEECQFISLFYIGASGNNNISLFSFDNSISATLLIKKLC